MQKRCEDEVASPYKSGDMLNVYTSGLEVCAIRKTYAEVVTTAHYGRAQVAVPRGLCVDNKSLTKLYGLVVYHSEILRSVFGLGI